MIVIDGDVCYTGGSNLADEYVNIIERFGHWKDGFTPARFGHMELHSHVLDIMELPRSTAHILY